MAYVIGVDVGGTFTDEVLDVSLDEESAREGIRTLLTDGISAIAVSLLWSFRNPAHEQRIREIDPTVFVSLSSEVSPRIREFARNATTIMSIQIGPGLRDYLRCRRVRGRPDRIPSAVLSRLLDGHLLVHRACRSSRPRTRHHPPPARGGPAMTSRTVGNYYESEKQQ